MPARCAPSTFSFTPPIGSTRPAQRDLAGHRDVAAHRAAATSPRPAPWPSRRPPTGRPSGSRPPARGCAPRSIRSRSSGMPSARACVARVGQRGARRLLHHVAELAGEDQRDVAPAAPARRPRRRDAVQPADRRLDEHDVAAHRRVVHAGRDADLVLLGRLLRVHRGRPSSSRTSLRRRSSARLDLARRELARDLAGHRADLRARAGARRSRACSSLITSHHRVVGERELLVARARSPRAGAGSGTSSRSRAFSRSV